MQSQNNSSEPPVAPPPPPEISLRTMQGDIKAVEAGEAVPSPQAVLPPELESIIEKPETISQLSGPVTPPPGGKKILKPGLIILGILVLGGGLGLLGYYVVYPLIFPAPTPKSPVVEQQPAKQTPLKESPTAQVVPHTSYFVTAPALYETLRLSDISPLAISNALQSAALNSPGENRVKEIAILDNGGSQVAFPVFAAALTNNALNEASLSNVFENDFTAYLYYDSRGVWPGYVAKIKSGVSAANAALVLSSVENMDLNFLYINGLGQVFQPFKDGKYKDYSTRYAVGSRSGASFNYGVFGNYAIISTSFDGLKAAAALLGF